PLAAFFAFGASGSGSRRSALEQRAMGASALLFGLAWLVPNHYFPWPAFHGDIVAAAALLPLALLLAMRWREGVEVPLFAWVLLAVAAVPVAQWAGGLILYGGDAMMASLYLAG